MGCIVFVFSSLWLRHCVNGGHSENCRWVVLQLFSMAILFFLPIREIRSCVFMWLLLFLFCLVSAIVLRLVWVHFGITVIDAVTYIPCCFEFSFRWKTVPTRRTERKLSTIWYIQSISKNRWPRQRLATSELGLAVKCWWFFGLFFLLLVHFVRCIWSFLASTFSLHHLCV